MAYMSQEAKKEIALLLKAAKLPKHMKYSLGVQHHSGIVMNIRSSDIDFLGNYNARTEEKNRVSDRDGHFAVDYLDVNVYHIESCFTGAVRDLLIKINKILNFKNYNNSDIMTDYFDVGHYVYINIGKWDKPFVHTGA